MSLLDDKTLALLSGYAAGILSDEERSALMEASLRDQAVFDALADEEALRQLLADNAARTRLLAVLAEPRAIPWYRRPWAWTAAAVPVLAGLLLVVFLQPREPEPQLMAEARRNELPAQTAAPEAPSAGSVAQNSPQAESPKRALAPPVVAHPVATPPASVSPVPARAPSALPPGTLPPVTLPPVTLPSAKAKSAAAPAGTAPAPARPAEAAEAFSEPARQSDAKGVMAAIPVTAPVPAPAPVPTKLQEAKRANEPATSALSVSTFRQEADLAPGARQKSESLAARDAASELLKVEILTRRSTDTVWSPVLENRVAVGDPLRLRITTTSSGQLRVRPGDRTLLLQTPVAPIEVDLGPLPAGAQTITVSLTPGLPGRSAARETGGTAARSNITLGSTLPSADPVTVVRRILVAPR